MIKRGIFICYRLEKLSKQARTDFCRKFLGFTDKSTYGKYSYKRKGFLDKIPYISPIKSLIIVRKEDSPKVLSFFRKHNIRVFSREILLKKSDLEKLK